VKTGVVGVAIILASVVALTVPSTQADPAILDPILDFSCYLGLKEDSKGLSVGVIELDVTLVKYSDELCSSLEVNVTDNEGLNLPDGDKWTVELAKGDSTHLIVPVEIPPNRVCRIYLEVSCKEQKMGLYGTFVSDSASVSFARGLVYPRPTRDELRGKPFPNEVQLTETAELDSILQQLPQTSRVQFVRGSDGFWYHPDSLPLGFEPWDAGTDGLQRDSTQNSERDTSMTWVYTKDGERFQAPRDSLERADKRRRLQQRKSVMEKLEESPCQYDSESFELDGQHYIRLKGESKFRPQVSPESPQVQWDSLRSLNTGERRGHYHIVVDLSKTKDSLFVAGLVDSLSAMDSDHLYHLHIDRPTLLRIRDAGVPFSMYPEKPDEQSSLESSGYDSY